MVAGSMRHDRMLLLLSLSLTLIACRHEKSLHLSTEPSLQYGWVRQLELCLPRRLCEPTSGKRWDTLSVTPNQTERIVPQ